MSLLEKLKTDSLQARKAGEAERVRATLLTTLISDIAMVGKNAGNRAATDGEAEGVLRKFLKSNLEAQSVVKDEGRLMTLRAEADVLESYLPKMAGEAEVRAAVAEIVANLPERSPKAMGAVMAELKTRFGANFDAKTASAAVRTALQ